MKKSLNGSLRGILKGSVHCLFLSVALSVFLTSAAIASEKCFLLVENNKILMQEGEGCVERFAPASTFKIALAVMGYDTGILEDATHPQWNFQEGDVDSIPQWRRPQTPTTWIKYSCVWFSQKLTRRLGMEKIKAYLAAFAYGNQDMFGDKGKNNGLTRAWLSSSLQISPQEQSIFLGKLTRGELPVSEEAQQKVRELLFIEALPERWSLYGKTDSGSLLNADGTQDTKRQIGWFVGWLQKEERRVVFVTVIQDEEMRDTYAGLRAKERVREKLLSFIRESSKTAES